MANYAKHVSKRKTAQTDKARASQVKNSAGGYVFQLDQWGSLDRWLILGAEGGTYYASEKKLTRKNASTIEKCLKDDGIRTISRIVEISDGGRAPKNDAAILALALAASDSNEATRKAAFAAIPKVCRFSTDFFTFINTVKEFRGWGKGLLRSMARWYTAREPDAVAYQAIKYQQRDGMSHRDVLRLVGSAIGPHSVEHDAMFRYIVAGGMAGLGERKVVRKGGKDAVYPAIDAAKLPDIVHGWEAMKGATSAKEAVKLIGKYGLTREMVLTKFLKDPSVWEALLENMPATALIRNVGAMGACGLLVPFSDASKTIAARLSDAEYLKKRRVHPLKVFMAMRTYGSGKGQRGSLEWEVIPQITDAFETGFYASFGHVEPTNANTLIAVDCSGSMWGQGDNTYGGCGWGFPNIAGMNLPPRIGAALMAMLAVRTEANYLVTGFSSGGVKNGLSTVKISKRTRLDDAVKAFEKVPAGGTDCALPMKWALANNHPVEAFYVYTDNETWAGTPHPFQALKEYRQKTGINAKLCVVGMTATDFTIADPSDGGMLDVVGFDTNAPSIMSDFVRQGFGSKD